MGNKASTPKPPTPSPSPSSCKDKPCCQRKKETTPSPCAEQKVCESPCAKPCEAPCAKPCDSPCAKPCDAPCAKPCDSPCAKPSEPSTWSLAGKKLKVNSQEEMEPLLAELNAQTNVQTVTLNGNTFGVEASKALANAFQAHPTIKHLDMSDCFTGRMKDEVHVSIEAVGEVLNGSASLETINFSDNALGPIGAKALVPIISETPSLREIRINNNGLGPEGGRIIAGALEASACNSQLRCIVIGRNRLENGAAPFLGRALGLHGQVEQVCLPQNGIRPEGIVSLVSGLAACKQLKHLDLQDNTFTRPGALALAQVIPSWPQLTHLNIGDCLVGAEGCLAILRALVDSGISRQLVLLNLQYGEMNEEGAVYLASQLEQGNFPQLQSLLLNGNAFAPEGAAGQTIRRLLGERNDEWSDMEVDSDLEDEEEESEEESVDERQVGVVPVALKQEMPAMEDTKVVEAAVQDATPLMSLADDELSAAIEATELRPEDLSKKLEDLVI